MTAAWGETTGASVFVTTKIVSRATGGAGFMANKASHHLTNKKREPREEPPLSFTQGETG